MRPGHIQGGVRPAPGAAAESPAAALTGLRQLGRTTVLKHLFDERGSHVSPEALDARAG